MNAKSASELALIRYIALNPNSTRQTFKNHCDENEDIFFPQGSPERRKLQITRRNWISRGYLPTRYHSSNYETDLIQSENLSLQILKSINNKKRNNSTDSPEPSIRSTNQQLLSPLSPPFMMRLPQNARFLTDPDTADFNLPLNVIHPLKNVQGCFPVKAVSKTIV